MTWLLSRSGPLAAVVLLGACDLNLYRTNGNSEKGYFQIEPTESLAVGAWLTYTVRDYEFAADDDSGIGFRLVSTSDDEAARIRTMTPAADVVVDGLAQGRSRVAFSAVADGDRMDDAFTIDVQDITRVRFGACSDGGVYVRGTDGQVSYAFSNSAVSVIKGLGLYPFSMIPPEVVTLKRDLSTVDFWQFAIPQTAPDTVRLISTLPGDASDFAMTVIDPRAIDGVISTAGSSNSYYGRVMTIRASPVSAGRPVCAKLRRTVSTTTPSVCTLIKDGLGVISMEVTGDTVMVDFVTAGKCILTLLLPDLGVTVAWPPWVLTAPQPSGGGSHFDD